MAEEFHESTVREPGSQAVDALGALAVYLLFSGVIQVLWGKYASMPSSTRAWILAALTLFGFQFAGYLIAPTKDTAPRAPVTARCFGLFGWLMLGLGLFEFGRAYSLPPSQLAPIALGVAGLFAGEALSGGLLAFMGAVLVHGFVSDWVALSMGLVGGYATSAIFVYQCVGFLMTAVGVARIRKGATTSGGALLGWGMTIALISLFLLSFAGSGYHGTPDSQWIDDFYVTAFFGVGWAALRAGRRFGVPLMSIGAVLLMYWRALALWVEHIGPVAQHAYLLSLGIVLLLAATQIDRSGSQRPASSAAGSPECRAFGLSVARFMAVLLLGSAALRGVWNGSKVTSEVVVPISAGEISPVVILNVPHTAIEYPRELRPGESLTVYALLSEFSPNQSELLLGRCIATRVGEPPPAVLDPAQTLRLPGTFVQGRDAMGGRYEGVWVKHRMVFELSREHWQKPGKGRELVLQIGRSGFISGLDVRFRDGSGLLPESTL